jgi:hypothetical protein
MLVRGLGALYFAQHKPLDQLTTYIILWYIKNLYVSTIIKAKKNKSEVKSCDNLHI